MTYTVFKSNKIEDENKTPLIIMHGLLGSRSNWKSLGKAINQKTGFPVSLLTIFFHI